MRGALRVLAGKEFHARLIIGILYLEKISRWKFPLKVARRLICQSVYHVEVHPDSFDSPEALLSLRLPHPFLIVVHRSARIGCNVTLFHNVTIGAREQGHAGFPRLCEGSYIGTGATLLGNVNIGRSAVIGAGALILGDVMESATVVGVHK